MDARFLRNELPILGRAGENTKKGMSIAGPAERKGPCLPPQRGKCNRDDRVYCSREAAKRNTRAPASHFLYSPVLNIHPTPFKTKTYSENGYKLLATVSWNWC